MFKGGFRLGTRAWDGCGAKLDAAMGHADVEPRRGSQDSPLRHCKRKRIVRGSKQALNKAPGANDKQR